jgi:hypothetical protein
MSEKLDPVQTAQEIFEGKTNKEEKEVSEGLRDALKDAVKEGLDEFDFEGKTYKVEDFNESEVEGTGGEGVPAADAGEEKTPKETKKDKMSSSSASAKAESVELDFENIEIVAEESDDSDMTALFSGEELSEEFKTKATTIFEAAVSARVKDIAETLEEQANAQVSELVEAQKAELTESLDDYLNYVVSEWVSENELAVERGLKSEITESFMGGLKNLFESHFIDMPEDKYDLVSELEAKIESLEDSINEEMQKNIELSSNLSEAKAEDILFELSEGLVDTQVEKFAKLAEGLEYDTLDQYREKLSLLKESYFGLSSTSMNVISEDEVEIEDTTEDVINDPQMNRYSQYLSKQSKHNNY